LRHIPQKICKHFTSLVHPFHGTQSLSFVHHILRAVATELGAAKRHWNNFDSAIEIPPHSKAIEEVNMTENWVVFTFCWG
jgi:hypothetical protein